MIITDYVNKNFKTIIKLNEKKLMPVEVERVIKNGNDTTYGNDTTFPFFYCIDVFINEMLLK